MKVCPKCGLKYPDDNDQCFVDRSSLELAPDEYLGTTLEGKYYIESILGEGGMATVYRARHTLVDRPVAVKIMEKGIAADPSMRERFRREAKNAAAIAHPNIIRIDDYGEAAGTCYLVMEILDGASLTQVIDQGPMPPDRVASLGLQIAQGLARAHDFDVIHRDLKPDNIFVCDPGGPRPLVKLLDFGIARSMHDARLTSAGQIFGTPQYMAPERVTSIDAGPAADLYALGIILFEMLVGTPPFDADSIPGFFIKHMRDAPPRPSTLAPQCPRRLEELILALLEKSPDARPVDAHQVIKELSALAPVQGARSVPPPPMVAAARPAAAPTLLPTTLELWGKRTAVFDEMMQRAYPNGGAPAALVNGLAQIRSALATIQQLRSDGLKAQRQLEALEGEVRVGRARLGNAVQTLGEDLSNARNAARQAVVEVEPYFEADRQAQGAYEKAHAALETLGGYAQLPEPRADLARALRSTVDSLDRWVLSHGAAQKAHRWVDSKQGEVGDLEFQIKALRQQLERLEGQYEQDRQSNEQTLKERGQAAEALEKQLLQMASDFCEPLRPRGELRALFAQLERAAG